MITLSIIIPAYNEEKRLPDTLALLRSYLEKQTYSYEVVIVDDGSKDQTVKVVKEIMKRFPGLRIIENEINKGKGKVVKQGMLEAKGEYRLFMDADHSTPVNEIEKLLEFTPEYPIVIGSRYLDPNSIKVKQPLKRRILSRMGNLLIQALVLPGVKDTQCGFKLFSAEACIEIFPRLQVEGWSFDIEILTIAKVLGYAIKEVPVDWYDANESTLRAGRAARSTFKDLLKVWRNKRRGIYKS